MMKLKFKINQIVGVLHMKKNSVFFVLLFLMVLAVPAKATWYPRENTDIITVPEGYSEADVLQALHNSRVPEDHKMSSKEAKKAFNEQCRYDGFCDYVNGVAIKVGFKNFSKSQTVNCQVFNWRHHGEGAAQKALQPLLENPPPSKSKYPNVIKLVKYFTKIGVLD